MLSLREASQYPLAGAPVLSGDQMATTNAHQDVIDEHKNWLSKFPKHRLEKWSRLFKSQSEPAICEAHVRRLLEKSGVKPKPYEDRNAGGPDFLCSHGGSRFYVESTCITTKSVTEKTNLSPRALNGAQHYRKLTGAFMNECCNKAKQCSGLDAPCLLAIGTLHFQASCQCFGRIDAEWVLTGTPGITCDWNSQTGQAVGEPRQTTKLADSSVLKPTESSVALLEEARRSISGVLLCGFGSVTPTVHGILHPNPARPFDGGLLPDIMFCRLNEGLYQKGVFDVEWV